MIPTEACQRIAEGLRLQADGYDALGKALVALQETHVKSSDRKLISLHQTAKLYGFPYSSLNAAVHRGDLPATCPDGRFYVRLADVDTYFTKHLAVPVPNHLLGHGRGEA